MMVSAKLSVYRGNQEGPEDLKEVHAYYVANTIEAPEYYSGAGLIE